MGEAIVVTSGKGGVGKSTTSCNIGVSLALSDKKVCLVDTDIGLRNLDVLLGLENRIVFDLVDVIEENCLLSQALIKDQRCEELYLLPSAQAKDKSAVSATQINRLISQLKEQFDYVIVDCPAGIERGFKNAIRGAERGSSLRQRKIPPSGMQTGSLVYLKKKRSHRQNSLSIGCVRK